MLTIQQLPKPSQVIAWKLKEFCEQNGIQYAFRKANGSGHPSIEIWYDGEKRKLAFSSSPSDHRAPLNAVRQLKRKLVEMGWSPAQRELDIGEKKVPFEDTFKNQKQSSGAASPVTSIDPKIVQGVAMPIFGASTIDQRNEAMLQANEAGAPHDAIIKALHAAGWDKITSVSGHLTRARNIREGLAPKHKRRPVKEAPAEAPTPDPKFISVKNKADGLALEIAEAIAPIIETHLRSNREEIAELREKAQRFDDLKKLIG